MDKNDNGIDDTIILKGLGLTWKWQLPPNTTRCPFTSCREAFEERSALVFHYQEQHAPQMVYCELCAKPFSMPHVSLYVEHYKKKHPNLPLPTELIRKMRRKSIHGRPTENVSVDRYNYLLVLFTSRVK